ncbi:MAG: lipopolysaccharide kinase InaA family protein [Candidatus Woesearchaeota archaeon]
METAKNLSQLEEFIHETRKKARFKIFETPQETTFLGYKIGGKTKGTSFTNFHDQIIYQDEIIDIKTTTIAGNLGILKTRPISEWIYNNSFITFESIKNKVKRERKILEYLEEKGFQSFKSRQNINDELQKSFEDVLITKYEENLENSLDYIKSLSKEEKQEYVTRVARKLRELHDLGVLWGDARLGNTGLKQDELYLFDFELKPNPKMSLEDKETKDLQGLILNTAGVNSLFFQDSINAILEGYADKEIIYNLQEYANRQEKFPFRTRGYLEPVHQLDLQSERKVKEIIKMNLNDLH